MWSCYLTYGVEGRIGSTSKGCFTYHTSTIDLASSACGGIPSPPPQVNHLVIGAFAQIMAGAQFTR